MRLRDAKVEARLEDALVEHVVEEHKTRGDLAMLWIAEAYAQFQGYVYMCVWHFDYVCTYVSMSVCLSVCMYVCISVCMSVCISVCQ